MGFPQLVIGILLSAIGFISFGSQQNVSGHTPFAYLMPYITAAPIKKETADLLPTHVPSQVSSTHVLGYTVAVTPAPSAVYITPTPVPTIVVSTGPTLVPTSQPVNNVQVFIMQAINDYRHANGLGSVTTNDLTCSFASLRAQEISLNFSHDGFSSRLNSHSLPYPSYSLVTENIAETGNYHDVVTLWANSPGHAANMRADTPYICVEQNGNYYAMEGWKPL